MPVVHGKPEKKWELFFDTILRTNKHYYSISYVYEYGLQMRFSRSFSTVTSSTSHSNNPRTQIGLSTEPSTGPFFGLADHGTMIDSSFNNDSVYCNNSSYNINSLFNNNQTHFARSASFDAYGRNKTRESEQPSVARVPQGDLFIIDPGTKSNIEGRTFTKNDEEEFVIGTEDVNRVSGETTKVLFSSSDVKHAPATFAATVAETPLDSTTAGDSIINEQNELEVTNVTDSKVAIKIEPEKLEHLRLLLDSKDTLKKNTPHAVYRNEENAKEESATVTHDNNADNVNIKDNEWFRKVVSDEFIKQNNLTEVFNALNANSQFNEGLLTTEVQFTLPDKHSFMTVQSNLMKLQSAITDEDTLAKILAGEEPLIAAHNKVFPTRFARIISKIISDEDNCTIDFVINNGAFAQTLQAYKGDGKSPIIASDLKGLFIIDKQYLLKYLSPIFNGLIWSEKEKVPIVFGPEDPETPRKFASHYINIVIDTSTSMRLNFSAYINNVKAIVDKLGDIPNWHIKIVNFNTLSTEQEFSLKNGNTIDHIKRHIETFVASGWTRLYGTVLEALMDIKSKANNEPNLNCALIVFTDGDDTVNSPYTDNHVIQAAADLKGMPQFNMYAVGFGETESGFQKFFKRLADFGGFLHIKLDDPNGMDQLQQYISTIAQKIDDWETK